MSTIIQKLEALSLDESERSDLIGYLTRTKKSKSTTDAEMITWLSPVLMPRNICFVNRLKVLSLTVFCA